jgi:hypothetical protein
VAERAHNTLDDARDGAAGHAVVRVAGSPETAALSIIRTEESAAEVARGDRVTPFLAVWMYSETCQLHISDKPSKHVCSRVLGRAHAR